MHFHHVLDCDSLIFNFIFLQYFKALSHGIRSNSDQIKGKKNWGWNSKKMDENIKKKKVASQVERKNP